MEDDSHLRGIEPHGFQYPAACSNRSLACMRRAICHFVFPLHRPSEDSRDEIPSRQGDCNSHAPVRLIPPASRRMHRTRRQKMPSTVRKPSDDGLMCDISQRSYKELSLLPAFEFIRILELILLNLPLLVLAIIISVTSSLHHTQLLHRSNHLRTISQFALPSSLRWTDLISSETSNIPQQTKCRPSRHNA